MFVRLRMAEVHFWSLEASQNESDVTNRFDDRDFLAAVCTFSLCTSEHFEVNRDFRSFKNGGLSFAVAGSIAEQK
jgi:hypothetical protein